MIRTIYEGNLKTRLTHEDSGVEILTEAPRDNGGTGDSFSPTDLLAAALSSCMLTLMGLAAKKLQLNIEGATALVGKEMTTVPLRRIKSLHTAIAVPGKGLSPDVRQRLEKAAMSCPVKESLHDSIEVTVVFEYED